MTEIELIQRIAVAAGIGLLVGVERGWRERDAGAGNRTAGIRTFTLSGLLGGVVGAITHAIGDAAATALILGATFLTFSAIFGAFRMRENVEDERFGMTTVVAGMATFLLGGYAVLGDQTVAAATAVAIVAILAVREGLHGWLHRITWNELRAAIVLAAMTFLALPIVPDESYGPFGGINPRQVWLLAVVLAGVSFLGYAAVKRFGEGQGLLVAAGAGGLVSSTAVNVTAARRAARGESSQTLLAASSTLATAVSMVRTIVLVIALNIEVAWYAAAPLMATTLAAIVLTYLLARKNLRGRAKNGLKLKNPFSLRETVILALLLAGVLFATRAAAAYFGSAGALAAAVLAGIADTDAPTYSMAELAHGTLPPAFAAIGLLLAVVSNTVFKVVAGFALGGQAYGWRLATGLLLPLVAGAAVAVSFALAAALN